MKATNAISGAGQQRVNAFFTRTDKGNLLSEVLTDVYTSEEYGGKLNADDLHFPTTIETVNGTLEHRTTIYDTMKMISKAQGYTVYSSGQDIILKKDGVQDITVGLFNETNTLVNSFRIQYAFRDEVDPYDCIEVEYRDSVDWEHSVSKYPTDGLYPQTMPLFGVTDKTQADTMAKYLWKQENARNKVVTFDTDIQGHNLMFLDKIKVSHSSLMWGEAGNVEGVVGSTIITSEPVSSDGYITIRNIDGSVSDALSFTRLSDYKIDVVNLPSFVGYGLGYTIGVAKEFLVVGVRSKDENSVSVECVEYNADIYN